MTIAMTLFSRVVLAGSLVLSLGLFSGCGLFHQDTDEDFPSAPAPAADTQTSPQTNSQDAPEVAHFQVGDTITVTLAGLPEDIPPHIEAIKEDGSINMPLIGHVQAAGKTAGELQNTIESLYVPKYYTHLNVTVTTGDRVYYVTGEVKSPGRQLYVGETTVTMAITSAGDFTDFANRKNVWLIHKGKKSKLNWNDIFNHPEKDPVIYPGDEVVVRRSIF